MLTSLLLIPAAVKVGGTFLAILIANRIGLPLGMAILLCSIALSFWAGMDGQDLLSQLSLFKKPENYLLPVVILLLLFFTEALNKTGRMTQTLEAMKSWLSNRKWLFVGLPALVGLLPMPEGAFWGRGHAHLLCRYLRILSHAPLENLPLYHRSHGSHTADLPYPIGPLLPFSLISMISNNP
jgi:hypothetical protein